MVIRHLQDLCLDNDARKTVHFYFNYRSSSSVTISGLYAYLLKGLVHTRALSSTTNTLGSHRRNDSTPSDGEILAMLKEEIPTYSSVYFVFDALDEAPESVRLNIIKRLFADLPDNARYLFTFRDLPEITNTFLQHGQRLDIVAHDQDLRTYINLVFQDNARLTRLAERCLGKEAVISRILGKADGMYASPNYDYV